MDWRLLVKERSANIGIPLDFCFIDLDGLEKKSGFRVLVNQSTVHNGGVSRGLSWVEPKCLSLAQLCN